MAISIQVRGDRRLQQALGRNYKPSIRAASRAIIEQIRNELTPYPPATIANSPSNPTGRWYQRGFGPRWRGGGRKTSEQLNRSWGVRRVGATGYKLGSKASYSAFLHSRKRQVRWASRRGWVTDQTAIDKVVRSGAVQRLVRQSVVGAFKRGR
ncbi:hypothetical protein LCGC14_0313330 [marine sediment metagenome]|uniref:Uncharacterized protein n=1 Tax=marine sediment metagenome TaxID=412755 RepID=A0A0F9W8Q8_9ZZZZ